MAKTAIVCNGAGPGNINPTLILGSAAAALGNDLVLFFTVGGAPIMVKGELEKLKREGAPDPVEMYDGILALGGRVLVCELCLELKNMKPEDFREGVEIAGATTFIADIQDATLTFCF